MYISFFTGVLMYYWCQSEVKPILSDSIIQEIREKVLAAEFLFCLVGREVKF